MKQVKQIQAVRKSAVFEETFFKRRFTLVNIQVSNHLSILPGGTREEEIPDPIPNSEVKLFIANGTAHKSVGE